MGKGPDRDGLRLGARLHSKYMWSLLLYTIIPILGNPPPYDLRQEYVVRPVDCQQATAPPVRSTNHDHLFTLAAEKRLVRTRLKRKYGTRHNCPTMQSHTQDQNTSHSPTSTGILAMRRRNSRFSWTK